MAERKLISTRYRRLTRILASLESRTDLTQLQRSAIRTVRNILLGVDPQDLSSEQAPDESKRLDEAEGLINERFPEGTGEKAEEPERSGDDSGIDRGDLDRARGRKQPQKSNIDKTDKGAKPSPSSRPAGPGAAKPAPTGAGQAAGTRTAATQAATRTAVATEAKVAAGGGARAGLAVISKSPYFWFAVGALLLILAIIGIWIFIAGGGLNRLFGGTGGSFFRALNYESEADRALVDKVRSLTESAGDPVIEVVAPAVAEDLWGWKEEDGKMRHPLDRRVLTTLDYMVDKGWDKIVVGLLKTNSPDETRRKKFNAGPEVYIDAISAYSQGQAMGLVALGKTSPGLTACMQLDNPIPVQIAWQRTTADNRVRPLQEKMFADLTYLAINTRRDLASAGYSKWMADREQTGSQIKTPLREDSINYLNMVKADLARMTEILNANQGSPAAKRYVADALTAFGAVDMGDVDASQGNLRRGINASFRMMQVANMVGWEGSRNDGCMLWKAFEARQNIRKLALQMLQMPVVRDEQGGASFDAERSVMQMIVYSPEDDLDNGLPDTDVFPFGAMGVDVGGMSYDTSAKDGKIDYSDNHFMALPPDTGISSKRSTVFVSKSETVEGTTSADTDGPEKELDQLWDGGYENATRQSFRNFIHIGF